MENAIFTHLAKKSNYMKADFFAISSNLVLASKRAKSRNRVDVRSSDFDRFMASECTETLIFAFSVTSKTGQSVKRTRHRIFVFGLFCQREDIICHGILKA